MGIIIGYLKLANANESEIYRVSEGIVLFRKPQVHVKKVFIFKFKF